MPLTISIALCTYNGERFLQEQLDSIANQTRLPDEVVVSDDGSTDSTLDILKKWAEELPFPVKIYSNASPLGFSKNFEKAMLLCSCDVLFCCDQDDVWESEKIEKMVGILEQDETVGVVYCNGKMVDENLKETGVLRDEWLSYYFANGPHSFLNPFACTNKITSGCCLSLRTSLLDSILPVPEKTTYDMWIYFLSSGLTKMNYLDEPLVQCRVHQNNASIKISAPFLQLVQDRHSHSRKLQKKTFGRYYHNQDLIKELKERLENLPENPHKDFVLIWLERNHAHFQNRKRIRQNIFTAFFLFLREIFSGGYFQKEYPFYNIREDMKVGFVNALFCKPPFIS